MSVSNVPVNSNCRVLNVGSWSLLVSWSDTTPKSVEWWGSRACVVAPVHSDTLALVLVPVDRSTAAASFGWDRRHSVVGIDPVDRSSRLHSVPAEWDHLAGQD